MFDKEFGSGSRIKLQIWQTVGPPKKFNLANAKAFVREKKIQIQGREDSSQYEDDVTESARACSYYSS